VQHIDGEPGIGERRKAAMDLGIQGRTALVCASSRGLGKACAMALAGEGVNVTINGLDEARLASTGDEIRDRTGVEVTPVAADLNTENGRSALLAVCPAPDILVNNNSGPPPGNFEDWSHDDWLAGVEANMLAPVMMIKGVIGGMQERRFGRIVNITSAMVKAPFTVMGMSAGARAGLTAFSKSLSRRVAQDNVTINNLLPERIDTDRQVFAKAQGITYEEAREKIVQGLAAKRMGRPEEFGAACAFLCGDLAGYISGQNLQLDGGTYPGVF
jgi:3-oxoacyl-[acyl-carrier protein] reductase